jgi:hypothetical protein
LPQPTWYSAGVGPSFAGRNVGRASAIVCLGCGRIKLYSPDLGDLRQYVERHPQKFVW